MKKITSYSLRSIDVESVDLPVGARILGVKDVYGVPMLFALIEQDEKLTQPVVIHRFRTGFNISDDILGYEYIESMLEANFGTVYHFFKEPNNKVFIVPSKEFDPPKEVRELSKEASKQA